MNKGFATMGWKSFFERESGIQAIHAKDIVTNNFPELGFCQITRLFPPL
jgi:hypothetical protein